MPTNMLVRFRRAFRNHDWSSAQRRRYAKQWCTSLRQLGPKWVATP